MSGMFLSGFKPVSTRSCFSLKYDNGYSTKLIKVHVPKISVMEDCVLQSDWTFYINGFVLPDVSCVTNLTMSSLSTVYLYRIRHLTDLPEVS